MLVLGVIFLGMGMMILLARLRDHRIDLGPRQGVWDGRSGMWQVNVLSSRNYDARGKALLRWLVLTWVLLAGCVFGFIFGGR